MRALILGILAALLLPALPASAHPTPFSYLDVRVNQGYAEVDLVAHIIDIAHDLNIDPPEQLLNPEVLAVRKTDISRLLASRFHLRADSTPLAAGPWSDPLALPERQSIRISSRFAIQAVPGTVTLDALMFPYRPPASDVHQLLRVRRSRAPGHSRHVEDIGRVLLRIAARGLGGHPQVRSSRCAAHPDWPGPPALPRGSASARRNSQAARTRGERLYRRAQHHAVPGGAQPGESADAHHRTCHRAQHRVRRRGQPHGPRRQGRQGMDRVCVRLHTRIRIR